MEKIITKLCKSFNGDEATIKIIPENKGINLAVFNTTLSKEEARRLYKEHGCFMKETGNDTKEWVIYVLKSQRTYFELYETLDNFIQCGMVKNGHFRFPGKPIIFMVQRKVDGLLVGFAPKPIEDYGIRIEVNIHGKPPILN